MSNTKKINLLLLIHTQHLIVVTFRENQVTKERRYVIQIHDDYKVLFWTHLNLCSTSFLPVQGERGECGTPGIKGDRVWQRYPQKVYSFQCF